MRKGRFSRKALGESPIDTSGDFYDVLFLKIRIRKL